MMFRLFYAAVMTFVVLNSYAWNSLGHQLVAQIAYDNLNPQIKKSCNRYNKAFNKFSATPNFVVAATWLDRIRKKDNHWYDSLHYIDIPFTNEDVALPIPQDVNALWGIKQAITVLSSHKATLSDKGLSLRILIHLVGDIHQPLHTVTHVSKKLPDGDLGGNLFPLAKNPIGNNLHKYWDNGGGILLGQSKKFQVVNKAHQLEKKWSCTIANSKKQPQQWINEAHQIALNQVYIITPSEKPSKKYQLKTQNISEKQLFFAGCRLAALLNTTVLADS